ncbi:hypothetical protein MATL_G00113340 [Megalops atlanticus]|uniref:TNFR-Cys domain-containing protein n=1 Tax=Megalops atlanticus TaxID=7932 RepID=A0A9D3Q258_MEGAT|nr:hypothetical protein MATL_G00113340 [Megalops atlanticus]
MEFHRCTPRSLILLCLFNLVCSVSSTSNSSECEIGFIPKNGICDQCEKNQFWLKKRGRPYCERCTLPCSEKDHLKQVKDCTKTTNRECRCDRGYYCDSPIQYTCRRCKRCPEGTFSNILSRGESCQPHTNCASQNMIEIWKGNGTHDSVCAGVSTGPSPRVATPTIMQQNSVVAETTALPSIPTKAALRDPKTESVTTEENTQETTRYLTKRALTKSHRALTGSVISKRLFSARSASFSPTPVPLSAFASTSIPPPDPGVSGPAVHTGPQAETPSWALLVLLVLLVVAVLLCVAKCHKGLVFRSAQQWKGLVFVRNQHKKAQQGVAQSNQQCRQHLVPEAGHGVEVLLPLSNPALEGVELGPGGVQQGTVDHTGGRENVNNTVGSIFIYSPGTVILGANTPERRREAEDRRGAEKDPGEEEALISTPQQESYEEGREVWDGVPVLGGPVRECVQEEERKELCYPIPATGK